MTGGRPLSPSEHCWTFLCGLREAARYLAGRMNVVRHPYERWAAVRLPDFRAIRSFCLQRQYLPQSFG